jgi:hypothetical protein
VNPGLVQTERDSAALCRKNKQLSTVPASRRCRRGTGSSPNGSRSTEQGAGTGTVD